MQKTFYEYTVTFWATGEEIAEDELNIPYAQSVKLGIASAKILFEVVMEAKTEDGLTYVIVNVFTEELSDSPNALARWIQEEVFDTEGVIGSFQLGACFPHTVEYEIRTTEKVVVFAENPEVAGANVPKPRDFVSVTRSARMPDTHT